MRTIERSAILRAPVDTVWSFFEDIGSYVSRFEPHTLTFEISPPGKISVGQKVHAVVKGSGGRKVEVRSEITELIPGRRIVETHTPGDFFRSMVEIVTLEQTPDGTLVKLRVEYEPRGLWPKILDLVFARRATERNFSSALSNLKRAVEARADASG